MVTREQRSKQNGHNSIVLWFTGLSGSGKSTLAHAVEEQLYQKRCRTFVLDGDNVRHGLCSDLGFSNTDRKENIRRIGEATKLMLEAGTIVLTAFISPFQEDREAIRDLMPHGDFIEIYCKASLETCEARDVKGQYKKAIQNLKRSVEIQNQVGINRGTVLIDTTTYMFLINKIQNEAFDIKKIKNMIIEIENIEFELNYRLYELLEEKSYLENAYKQIQEKADVMQKKLNEKFLSYPIPKLIIEEYNKVFK